MMDNLMCDTGVIGKSQSLRCWLGDDSDASMCSLLNIEEDVLLDLQSVPTKSPDDYFCFSPDSSPSPLSPLSSFSSPSPYSSPELPELESSFGSPEAPLFNEQLLEVDPMFFNESLTVSADVLPELERILSSVACISTSPESPSTDSSDTYPGRPTKKRKAEDGKDCKGNDILLARDQLLTMTSAEIEEYVAKLKSQRSLTAAEEKELKRQRRLIKNREYASQSRSRKKQYVDELEKTIETLRSENAALKQQVHSVSEDNKTLKRQMNAIATTIKKSAATKSSSLSVSSSGILTKMTTVGRPGNNTKNVSACLLAIMFMVFTFGMFWDNEPRIEIIPHQNQFSGRALFLFEEEHYAKMEQPAVTAPSAAPTSPATIISSMRQSSVVSSLFSSQPNSDGDSFATATSTASTYTTTAARFNATLAAINSTIVCGLSYLMPIYTPLSC